jgi:hypothetical protein
MPQTRIVFGGGEELVVTEQLDAVKTEIQAPRQIPRESRTTLIELNRNTGTKVYVNGHQVAFIEETR